jgi:hypothetical protein
MTYPIRRDRPLTAPKVEPTGVVVYPNDGNPMPVDLAYEGVDQDGTHCWRIVVEGPLPISGIDRIHVGTLPPHTAIMLPVEGARDGATLKIDNP